MPCTLSYSIYLLLKTSDLFTGLVPLVSALIDSKADVNARDKDLNTPLHYLVNNNSLGGMQFHL